MAYKILKTKILKQLLWLRTLTLSSENKQPQWLKKFKVKWNTKCLVLNHEWWVKDL